MANVATETKAQRVERLKRAKNPWEGLEEIRRFAREGFDSIPPEWIGTYFRWWGVYTQGDGAGVTGGKGGEGKALQRFMVRIRIPNGLLRSEQLRTIADLTRRYANGIADITVRQNIQLHWVTIEALPELLEALGRVGLNTTSACGDVTRNVTGCPVAGVDADEVVDASPLALEASSMLAGNADFYNLPRKFKISITGCRVWCPYPEINDVGLTAITRVVRVAPEVGFSLRVAGGLSTEPYLGARLNAFVRWHQVLPAIKGIAELFRDSEVLREHRERARLKFLFLRHGWTAESFLDELQRRVGFAFDPAVEEQPPADVYRDHVGIHPQKQPGYCYVGAAVLRGRITAEEMRAAADLAERFAAGELRATNMQNLLIVNVPRLNADDLAKELDAIGLKVGGSAFFRGRIQLETVAPREGRIDRAGHRGGGGDNDHRVARRWSDDATRGDSSAATRVSGDAEPDVLPVETGVARVAVTLLSVAPGLFIASITDLRVGAGRGGGHRTQRLATATGARTGGGLGSVRDVRSAGLRFGASRWASGGGPVRLHCHAAPAVVGGRCDCLVVAAWCAGCEARAGLFAFG